MPPQLRTIFGQKACQTPSEFMYDIPKDLKEIVQSWNSGNEKSYLFGLVYNSLMYAQKERVWAGIFQSRIRLLEIIKAGELSKMILFLENWPWNGCFDREIVN